MFQRICIRSLLFAACFITASTVFGQVDEAEAIKQLETAGGRVMTIAADTKDREVSLYLAGDSITDEHVALLRGIANIKWLNLANTAVTDEGLANLSEMKLTKLHLEKSGIGDAGLAHLKNQTELIYLNLYATKVTNEGLKHLTDLTKLRKLYVWQSGVDQEGMEWLKAKLPELEIIGEVKMEAPVVEEKAAESKAENKGETAKEETKKAEDKQDKKDK